MFILCQQMIHFYSHYFGVLKCPFSRNAIPNRAPPTTGGFAIRARAGEGSAPLAQGVYRCVSGRAACKSGAFLGFFHHAAWKSGPLGPRFRKLLTCPLALLKNGLASSQCTDHAAWKSGPLGPR